MKSFDEIRKQLQEHKQDLKDEYGVTAVGVFGSNVRGEQTEQSDVDILVDLEEPTGLIRLVQLSGSISQCLGTKVDLTTRKALKPHISERILRKG
jgi:predicted nucleotidyltransferase